MKKLVLVFSKLPTNSHKLSTWTTQWLRQSPFPFFTCFSEPVHAHQCGQ